MNRQYSLTRSQFITKKKSEVFNFFKNAENLEKITPRNLNFTILSPLPIIMDEKTLIEYNITLFGIKIYWRTLITEYNPSDSFKDIQLNGPYALWEHTHMFKECKNGTMMIDDINYSIPYGIIGRIAHFIWVKRQLNNIFNYRYQIIDKIFQGK